jgi:hypothetical protein
VAVLGLPTFKIKAVGSFKMQGNLYTTECDIPQNLNCNITAVKTSNIARISLTEG